MKKVGDWLFSFGMILIVVAVIHGDSDWKLNGEPLSEFGSFIASCVLFFVLASMVHTSSCVVWNVVGWFKNRNVKS